MISDDWLPTADNINTLPDPVRRYIHDIETRCDPTGDIQTIACLRDQVKGLVLALKGLNMTMTIEELTQLMKDRETLLQRIWKLEQQPLAWSLPDLANKVLGDSRSLTPDQVDFFRKRIEAYRG
jgi:hypothetical protein